MPLNRHYHLVRAYGPEVTPECKFLVHQRQCRDLHLSMCVRLYWCRISNKVRGMDPTISYVWVTGYLRLRINKNARVEEVRSSGFTSRLTCSVRLPSRFSHNFFFANQWRKLHITQFAKVLEHADKYNNREMCTGLENGWNYCVSKSS